MKLRLIIALVFAFVALMGCKEEQKQEAAKSEEGKVMPEGGKVLEQGTSQGEEGAGDKGGSEEAGVPEGPSGGEEGESKKSVPEVAKAGAAGLLAGNLLPAETMLAIGGFSFERWLGLLSKIGINYEFMMAQDDEYADVVALLGADPLTLDGFRSLGMDPSSFPVVAFVPGKSMEALGLFAGGLQGGHSCVAKVKEIALRRPADVQKRNPVGEATVGASPVLWLLGDDPGELAGAVVEYGGWCFYVFSGDGETENKEQETELRQFVSTLVNPETPRLSSVDGFSEVLEGSQGAVATVFGNREKAQALMEQNRDARGFVEWLKRFTVGAMWVKEDGKRLTYVGRARSVARGLASGGRDSAVRSLLPAIPVVGFQGRIGWDDVMGLFTLAGEDEKKARGEWDEAWGKAAAAAGLPAGTKLDQLWNGDVGLFFGHVSDDEQLVARSVVAVLGVKDEKLVASALDELFKLVPEEKRKREDVQGAPVWRVTDWGLRTAATVHDGRLWLLGDGASVAGIIGGEKGPCVSDERAMKLTQVLSETADYAGFVDMRRLLLGAKDLMRAMGASRKLAKIPYITEMEMGSFSLAQKGNVVELSMEVSMLSDVMDIVVGVTRYMLQREFKRLGRSRGDVSKPDMARPVEAVPKIDPPTGEGTEVESEGPAEENQAGSAPASK